VKIILESILLARSAQTDACLFANAGFEQWDKSEIRERVDRRMNRRSDHFLYRAPAQAGARSEVISQSR
jgi:hypothetical protein